ncbi:hypothetical protein KY359_06840 [Candidatus Woesearchaeota archaeon]|nr:hypothetical protein [Candidatus Woesearchaeota archaeon]
MQRTEQAAYGADMMAPIYMGYAQEGKKDKKKPDSSRQYSTETKRFLRELGIEPNQDDEDDLWRKMPFTYLGGSGGIPDTGPASRMMYTAPSSMMQQRGGYHPLVMQPTARPIQAPYAGDGKNTNINISYTAPDGTMYNMSVTSPMEKRGQALYNVLSGLYGLMMAEGESGQYKGGGAGKGIGKGYSGMGSYAGGGKGGR